uniref:non-specific serine/threonine protein kinase n=1 Tax=Syphacia muris TaxID=451379 RepID=A0A0N5ASF7_9BILA
MGALDEQLMFLGQPSSSRWVNENFVIGDPLGSGTFGSVYSVECRRNPGTIYAMKELTRSSLPHFIETELRVLQRCGGSHNIIKMHAAHRERDRVFIVMDYFEHTSVKEMLASLTTREIIDYMKNLLIALAYLHRKGIIHRDVKPSNFLYDRKRNRFALVDFGLCEDIKDGRTNYTHIRKGLSHSVSKSICVGVSESKSFENSVRKHPYGQRDLSIRCKCYGRATVCAVCQKRPKLYVNKAGTPGFRAPEILLKCSSQTTTIDIWAAGITFLALLCRRHTVMRPADDIEALEQMSTIFGTEPLRDLANKHGLSFLTDLVYTGVDIIKFTNAVRDGLPVDSVNRNCSDCKKLFYQNDEGICLCKYNEEESWKQLAPEERQIYGVVTKCLIVDPEKRYTADMLSGYFC